VAHTRRQAMSAVAIVIGGLTDIIYQQVLGTPHEAVLAILWAFL